MWGLLGVVIWFGSAFAVEYAAISLGVSGQGAIAAALGGLCLFPAAVIWYEQRRSRRD